MRSPHTAMKSSPRSPQLEKKKPTHSNEDPTQPKKKKIYIYIYIYKYIESEISYEFRIQPWDTTIILAISKRKVAKKGNSKELTKGGESIIH